MTQGTNIFNIYKGVNIHDTYRVPTSHSGTGYFRNLETIFTQSAKTKIQECL